MAKMHIKLQDFVKQSEIHLNLLNTFELGNSF